MNKDILEQVNIVLRNENGQVLLVQQNSGVISLPGGAVEKTDAAFIDAAIRELHEELGVLIEKSMLTELKDLFEFYYERPGIRHGKTGRIHAFTAKIDKSVELRAGSDIASFDWYDLDVAKKRFNFDHHRDILNSL